MNYYNDNDPFCCGWLKELVVAGLLPEGGIGFDLAATHGAYI